MRRAELLLGMDVYTLLASVFLFKLFGFARHGN